MDEYRDSESDIICNNYPDLVRAYPEVWKRNATCAVLAVKFKNSPKIYRYYTHEITLEAGDILEIDGYGEGTTVSVNGYCNMPGLARRKIQIIQVLNTRPKKKAKTNLKSKKTKLTQEKTTMSNLTKSAEKTIKKSAKMGLTIQKGNAGLTALHTAIQNAEAIPQAIKDLLEAHKDYADLIIGLSAESLANVFADSTIIRDAAESVNTAATAKLAINITVVQTVIENIITNVMNPKAKDQD